MYLANTTWSNQFSSAIFCQARGEIVEKKFIEPMVAKAWPLISHRHTSHVQQTFGCGECLTGGWLRVVLVLLFATVQHNAQFLKVGSGYCGTDTVPYAGNIAGSRSECASLCYQVCDCVPSDISASDTASLPRGTPKKYDGVCFGYYCWGHARI